jgi:hypothetical protein
MSKILIRNPNGEPYLTVRADENMTYIQIHQYDNLSGGPIEFTFDNKAREQVIAALQSVSSQWL